MTATSLPPVTGFLQERDLETEKRTEKRRPCDDGGRDWSDAATSQRTPRIAGNHQKLQRRVDLEGAWPCCHLDFRLLDSRNVEE